MTFTLTGSFRVEEFPNRHAALRWISKNMQFSGWCRPVEQLYMPTHKTTPTQQAPGGWSAWYHFGYRYVMTFEEYQQLAVVQQRYAQYHHYMTEVDAQWRDAGPAIHYADNSVEQPQVNRHGQTRNVMVKAPSGDACF